MKRFVKRICVFSMLATCMTSMGIVRANNWQDTPYSAYSGSGSDDATEVRAKMDKSKVYAHNQNTNDRTHRIQIAGTNLPEHSYGSPFGFDDCTYGAWHYDLGPGVSRYMSSVVKERGYSGAFLVYAEANQKIGYIYGVWSPDNKNGY